MQDPEGDWSNNSDKKAEWNNLISPANPI
jgi:hypothetical protein